MITVSPLIVTSMDKISHMLRFLHIELHSFFGTSSASKYKKKSVSCLCPKFLNFDSDDSRKVKRTNLIRKMALMFIF